MQILGLARTIIYYGWCRFCTYMPSVNEVPFLDFLEIFSAVQLWISSR